MFNNNCSIDLYNRDLQTTIIRFTHNLSSLKTDWILSESPLLALSGLLYCMISSLMECPWRRMSFPFPLSLLSLNLYKCKQMAWNVVVACLFVYPLLYTALCCRLFTSTSLFYTDIVAIFFVFFADHVNKPIIFVFEAFIYHFKNTISILVTILSCSLQLFSQDYNLAFHSTYVVCVNFIHEYRDLQFKVDYDRQFFEKNFSGNFIYSLSFCQKSAERKTPKNYFLYRVRHLTFFSTSEYFVNGNT